VAPWCSSSKGVMASRQSSGSIISKTAVAASLVRAQWQNCKSKIYPKSNNQPMMMVRTKATSNSSGSNSIGVASTKSGNSKSNGSNFGIVTAMAAEN